MAGIQVENGVQITLRKSLEGSVGQEQRLRDWVEAYFAVEVTTLDSSRKVQRRDLELFARFFEDETKGTVIDNWTPRLSQAFLNSLRATVRVGGGRQWNDRTINRILAHIKTFSKWVERVRPFALGDPMEKVRTVAAASLLSIERALTSNERRRILDAADLLPKIGGRSKDRNRFKGEEGRPVRKGYRPYRNRAVVYALIETGMRRAAVAGLLLDNVDFKEKRITVVEKGAVTHTYKISREGIAAILEYVEKERGQDSDQFGVAELFLAARSSRNKSGRLHPNAINDIWNQACDVAGVEGKTPHSARHAMGKFLIEQTGNIEAVQRQLGHRNAAYSLQYSRIAEQELAEILESRDHAVNRKR